MLLSRERHLMTPFVILLVNGREVRLPESAISAGLSYLKLIMDGHVCLEDYAETVALVLAALENDSLVDIHA